MNVRTEELYALLVDTQICQNTIFRFHLLYSITLENRHHEWLNRGDVYNSFEDSCKFFYPNLRTTEKFTLNFVRRFAQSTNLSPLLTHRVDKPARCRGGCQTCPCSPQAFGSTI